MEVSAPPEDGFPFAWGALDLGELTVAQGAVIIPARVQGIARSLRLQLDTGSAETLLYGNTLTAADLPEMLAQTAVRVADCSPVTLDVPIRADYGAADWETNGTAGVNLFPDGFILDLAATRIRPLTTVGRASFSMWIPLETANGSPILPVRDGTRTLRLLLDTGSSAFTILSTAGFSEGIAAAEFVRTLAVPSFGRMLAIGELMPRTVFSAFGKPLNLPSIYAFDDPDIADMLRGAGIDGLIGLQPFIGGMLAFDFPDARIAFASESV